MSQLWSFENYTPETHNLMIEELKRENEGLKAMLSSSQDLCLVLKEELDRVHKANDRCAKKIENLTKEISSAVFVGDCEWGSDEDPLPSPPLRREHRRASP
tara:strand:- start:766 stop:1068 length:303 start_codon:yes stop_codon:yes gene_type:complete